MPALPVEHRRDDAPVRRRRPSTRTLVYAVPLVLVAAGLPLYVFPAQQTPRHADVVYVLGSPDSWRIDLAERIIEDGHATALLISVPAGHRPPSTCSASMPYRVVCASPRPASTDGEARLLRAELHANGWRSAVAVTSTPHITRAGLILRQCVPQGVSVVGRADGIDLGEWARQYLYQTAAMAKALLVPAC